MASLLNIVPLLAYASAIVVAKPRPPLFRINKFGVAAKKLRNSPPSPPLLMHGRKQNINTVSSCTTSLPDISTTASMEDIPTFPICAAAGPDEDRKQAECKNQETKSSIFSRIKNYFKPHGGLSTKQRLAKMGSLALMSYGWVMNMSVSVAWSLAWYGFTKTTGLSPLAPGQWKGFLATYAGFHAANHLMTPIHFGITVAVTKYFDNAAEFIQEKAKCSRWVSIAVVAFLTNVCGTLGAMALGVSLASAASGVAIFPMKA